MLLRIAENVEHGSHAQHLYLLAVAVLAIATTDLVLLLVEEMREYVLKTIDLVLEVVLVLQGYVLDLILEELRVVHQFSQIVDPIRDVAVRVKGQKGHYRNNDSETGQGSFD